MSNRRTGELVRKEYKDDDSDAVSAHPLSLPQVLSSMRGYLENESDVIKSGKSKLSETFMYDCYFSFQFTHVLLALNA